MKPVAYKNYLLVLLVLTLASNYVDRFVLGLLLQDIKVDLSLSDTQLGLLSGIAFALFYSVMGIPIARWADRGNRVTIITLATATWSVAVALCGLAGNFIHLLLIRVFVGVGEAGFVPPAHSLMADYFNRAERPRAVAIFKLGTPLSLVIGYMCAGWLAEMYGWRATFMMLGLPGLALAAVTWLTMKEPRIQRWVPNSLSAAAVINVNGKQALVATVQPSFREVCAALWANVTFRHLLFAYSLVSLFGTGISKWQPAFFIRSYGLSTGELGTWLAVVAGGGALLGTYLGGALATRYAAHDERLQLRSMALAYTGFGIVYLGIFFAPNLYSAFALMGLAMIGGNLVVGPLFGMIQTIVPERMRAMSIALVFLFANLIGMGIGPLATGALSDLLRPAFGEESLRYALAALCPGYAWCGWHAWRASRTVVRDLESAQR
ncbi:MAG TPA: MFS transporter [Steroidobacter sp.]|uniref:spinster family MFS transporter n=1 Tax=Steroidobacter sp. TaxID=1978227 RepID=UPI002ED90AF2